MIVFVLPRHLKCKYSLYAVCPSLTSPSVLRVYKLFAKIGFVTLSVGQWVISGDPQEQCTDLRNKDENLPL